MDPRAQPLTDTEIGHLAEYYAGLPCVPRRAAAETAVTAPSLLQRCAYCHGQSGTIPYLTFPDIGGQKKVYLVVQLRAFRKAGRHGADRVKIAKDPRFHRIMEPSVYDLDDRQIDALADYYSRQSCR